PMDAIPPTCADPGCQHLDPVCQELDPVCQHSDPVCQEFDPVCQIPTLCAHDHLAHRVVNYQTVAPSFLPVPRPVVSRFRKRPIFVAISHWKFGRSGGDRVCATCETTDV